MMARLVPMCDVCRRVFDAGYEGRSSPVWIPLHTFFAQHASDPAHVSFSHAYCDDCHRSYDLAVQYGSFR